MIPNPIRRVLSSMEKHRVRVLLMGGQACVFYGAAEFSRDIDFAILAEESNLNKLRKALMELRAQVIAVPPFERKYLRRGHAVHFRCFHPEAMKLRIDVMAKMRGVDSFAKLWSRRTTIALPPDDMPCDLLSLPDLVSAKKTQRDKDWPMIRRLVEAHYFQHRKSPNKTQIRFWLRELRTPELLIETALRFPEEAGEMKSARSLLKTLKSGSGAIAKALAEEENRVRVEDAGYWKPLRQELEKLRHI